MRANDLDAFASVCFAIGVALLALFILFRRQHIDITDIKCSVNQYRTYDDWHPIGVSGFIKVRHPVELLDCKLIVANDKKEYFKSKASFSLPEIIDSVPRSFEFDIPIGKEDVGELIDWGLVYIKVAGKLLYTQPFQITTKTPTGKGWFKDIAETLIPKTKQLKDEGEITKKKLHELFDRASQPTKNSEKEESQA